MREKLKSPLTLEHLGLVPTVTPMKHWTQILNFDAYFKRPDKCGLDVYETEELFIAIATELFVDTSITNRIEEVAFQIGIQFIGDGCAFATQPKQFVIIEHYPEQGGELGEEHFDLVRFPGCRDGRPVDPKWYRLEYEQIKRLIGQEFEPKF